MKLSFKFSVLSFFIIFSIAQALTAQTVDQTYKMPPSEIAELIDAAPTPLVSISPGNNWMLILEYSYLKPIEDVARQELRLAGLRIDPVTNGPSRIRYYKNAILKSIDNGQELDITGLPENSKISNISWSPNNKFVSFTLTDQMGIYLWLVDLKSGQARKLSNNKINAVYGDPTKWLSDSKSLICKTVVTERANVPVAPRIPSGPIIQENLGKIAPAATYADLLKNGHDEAVFEYYLTSQIMNIDLNGNSTAIGKADLFTRVEPSPDGTYLLVETIHRPYSYLVNAYRFPHRIEIWNTEGKIIRQLADQPLAEDIPVVSAAVRRGPREYDWRDDVPSTIYFVEALDDGDPRIETDVRDQVYTILPPFQGDAIPLLSLQFRYGRIFWGYEKAALVTEWWWKTRRQKVWAFSPSSAGVEPELVFDYSWQDRYNDPGNPIRIRNEYGRYVLQFTKDGRSILLNGTGASDEGDRPFLDRYDLQDHKAVRLWRSEAPNYEYVNRVIDPDKIIFISRRESIKETPNYFLRELENDKITQLTAFPHPTPQLMNISKELIKYKRDDGLDLTGKLYLPAGYNPETDGPLPLLMWAYPREYKSASAAGQVTDSPYRFIRVGWWSPILWLTRGYAVLDYPAMPIIGEGDTEPNDLFREQLVANAKAAIDEAVRRGVADPDRVAIGGHSYGAFMTANLLAHSDLFRAGIARTGAYNRTLTPFGFQSEDRTYWEAPDVYNSMSPFMHADKVDEPILLIHGEADNNPGTFPIQSKRFFNALKGHGATCRLVMLPYESHSYRARENIMHMLYETDRWLEQYVKNALPREPKEMILETEKVGFEPTEASE